MRRINFRQDRTHKACRLRDMFPLRHTPRLTNFRDRRPRGGKCSESSRQWRQPAWYTSTRPRDARSQKDVQTCLRITNPKLGRRKSGCWRSRRQGSTSVAAAGNDLLNGIKSANAVTWEKGRLLRILSPRNERRNRRLAAKMVVRLELENFKQRVIDSLSFDRATMIKSSSHHASSLKSDPRGTVRLDTSPTPCYNPYGYRGAEVDETVSVWCWLS